MKLAIPLILILANEISYGVCHMAPWAFSTFAFNGPDQACLSDIYQVPGLTGNQTGCQGGGSNPIGGLTHQLAFKDWWFRGPYFTGAAQLPTAANASLLPAGGQITFDITCTKDFGSYGVSPTNATHKACNSVGPYHTDESGDANNPDMVAGCALGIADTTDFNQATMENIVIFSVLAECVVDPREHTFDIPKNMPTCSGDYCVCSWFWVPKTGGIMFYMTGFYCKVTGGSSAYKLGVPQNPVRCDNDTSSCITGPKKPLYTVNVGALVFLPGPADEGMPGYNPSWGFQPGAQDDALVASDGTAATANTGNDNSTTPPSTNDTSSDTSTSLPSGTFASSDLTTGSLLSTETSSLPTENSVGSVLAATTGASQSSSGTGASQSASGLGAPQSASAAYAIAASTTGLTSKSGSGLSTTAIIGIIAGIVVFILVLFIAVLLRRPQPESAPNPSMVERDPGRKASRRLLSYNEESSSED